MFKCELWLNISLNWKQIRIVEIPSFDSRGTKNVDYANNCAPFTKNLAIFKVRTVYSYQIGRNSRLSFVDENDVVHSVTLPIGWKNIEDIGKGAIAGFTESEGSQYYSAIESGFSKSDSYNKFRQSGFPDKKTWQRMKSKGFRMNNEYVMAEKMECSTMKEYQEIVESGFPNKTVAKEAPSKGLKTVTDYLVSKTLEEIPDNRAIGLNEISRIFGSNLQDFRSGYSEYYSRGTGNTFLSEMPQILDLLQSNIASKFGKYDQKLSLFAKGESQFNIETEWKVAVVDAPNVARHPDGEGKMVRVVAVRDELVKKKLKCIISASAAMAHWIDDKKTYKKMVKSEEIIQCPSKRDDDHFSISMALEENAYFITNDGLDNYKEANPKYAEEIDKRRVTFTIRDVDKVTFDAKLSSLKSPTD